MARPKEVKKAKVFVNDEDVIQDHDEETGSGSFAITVESSNGPLSVADRNAVLKAVKTSVSELGHTVIRPNASLADKSKGSEAAAES